MEFDDLGQARREAVITVGEITHDALREGDHTSQDVVVVVSDESRTPLFKAVARFEVQSLTRVNARRCNAVRR